MFFEAIMIVDVLTHVPFEDAANIESWAKLRGHSVRYCHLYAGQPLPDIREVEFLAVMGGPMNVYDTDIYTWLVDEKRFIEKIIKRSIPVIGICLGAQLIADVLGAKVRRNAYREIGWHDVFKTAQDNNLLLSSFSDRFTTFQWHGDTFDIPAGAVHLAFNDACENQAFQYGQNVLGLQFHIEYTKHSIDILLDNCRDEMDGSIYVQTEKQIYDNMSHVDENCKMLFKLMDNFKRI